MCCAGAGGSGRSGGIKGEASIGKTTWASCLTFPVAITGAAERARKDIKRLVVMLPVDVHLVGFAFGRLENMVGVSSTGRLCVAPRRDDTKERARYRVRGSSRKWLMSGVRMVSLMMGMIEGDSAPRCWRVVAQAGGRMTTGGVRGHRNSTR